MLKLGKLGLVSTVLVGSLYAEMLPTSVNKTVEKSFEFLKNNNAEMRIQLGAADSDSQESSNSVKLLLSQDCVMNKDIRMSMGIEVHKDGNEMYLEGKKNFYSMENTDFLAIGKLSRVTEEYDFGDDFESVNFLAGVGAKINLDKDLSIESGLKIGYSTENDVDYMLEPYLLGSGTFYKDIKLGVEVQFQSYYSDSDRYDKENIGFFVSFPISI